MDISCSAPLIILSFFRVVRVFRGYQNRVKPNSREIKAQFSHTQVLENVRS